MSTEYLLCVVAFAVFVWLVVYVIVPWLADRSADRDGQLLVPREPVRGEPRKRIRIVQKGEDDGPPDPPAAA